MVTEKEICRKCGAEIPVNDGYIKWCDKCNWNVDPGWFEKKKNVMNQIYDKLGKKLSENLFKAIKEQEQGGPKFSFSVLAAYLLALAIYLINYGLMFLSICAGVKIINMNHFNMEGYFLSLIFFAGALIFRPRFRKNNYDTLNRSEYPNLYRLTDYISEMLGVRGVDGIVVNNEYNACIIKTGFIKTKKIVFLGFPIFYILNEMERVALLSHELAHDANNDMRRNGFIHGALEFLESWYIILRIEYNEVWIGGASAILNFFRWLICKAIISAWNLIHTLLWYNSQRAEYLADHLAATVSGCDAMVSTLEKLYYEATFSKTLKMSLRFPTSTNIFDQFADSMKRVPQREIERIKRVIQLRSSGIDSSHPPTVYRMEALKSKNENGQFEISEEMKLGLAIEIDSLKNTMQKEILENKKMYFREFNMSY